jgi:hypothetical protein
MLALLDVAEQFISSEHQSANVRGHASSIYFKGAHLPANRAKIGYLAERGFDTLLTPKEDHRTVSIA